MTPDRPADGSTDAFGHLLSPGRIGPMALRNRIVMTPMGDRLAHDDGTVSPRQRNYLEARARGGAGLVMIGSVAVSYPAGAYATCQTAISDDRFVPGLRVLTDRVHAHGACLGAQLVHDGANSLLDIAEGRPMLVPSIPPRLRQDRLSGMVTPDELAAMTRPFTGPTSAVSYRIADEDDLAQVIEQFADAADRARQAGLDGVEIHAGHGYLIDSFLSPADNRREDRWGGAPANRARLLVEVLRAVRARVGDELAVWCRLNAVERFREGGETPDDLVEVAELAVAAGADAIHVSAATVVGAALGITEAHTPHEPGLLVPFAAMVKARVAVPVITVGRIEPAAAERLIADGEADFVAMGRKLLADPDLPNKLAAGRIDDIRPCIYQYRCIGNIFIGEPVGCVANPATAHHDLEVTERSASPRRVLVVGAGPSGLEAARLLAERGHDVVLADAGDRLGGTLALAATTDEALDRFLGWQVRQVTRADVAFRLGATVTPAWAAALGVDEVVLAPGGIWARPAVPGADDPMVCTVGDLGPWLGDDDDHATVGRAVAVLGGSKAALSVAARCAERGRQVTVIERTAVFAPELGPPGRFRLVHDTEQTGVRLVGEAIVERITPGIVQWAGTDGSRSQVHVDTVIVAEREPDPGAADAFRAAGLSVHVIGDAEIIGGIEQALSSARRVALAIG